MQVALSLFILMLFALGSLPKVLCCKGIIVLFCKVHSFLLPLHVLTYTMGLWLLKVGRGLAKLLRVHHSRGISECLFIAVFCKKKNSFSLCRYCSILFLTLIIVSCYTFTGASFAMQWVAVQSVKAQHRQSCRLQHSKTHHSQKQRGQLRCSNSCSTASRNALRWKADTAQSSCKQ